MNKKKLTRVMYVIIPAIAGVIYYVFPPGNSVLYSKRFYESGYQGVVFEKYIDVNNHNSKTIKLIGFDEAKKVFKVVTPPYNEDIYDFIRKGDTLIKYEDSNRIILKGDDIDTIMVYSLKYPSAHRSNNQ